MKNKLTQIIQFVTSDIWRIQSRQLKGGKSFLIRTLRVILLAIRGFDEDKCQLRASALTFFSLLSIVPVIAMAFGIAKGFGFEQKLQDLLYKSMAGQQEVAQRIIDFSHNMLANTQGGLIAGVGVALLFWAVIKVLSQIENSFNEIWGIKTMRPLGRKFTDYLSIMLICPLLMITASSVTVVVTSQVTLLMHKLSFLGPVANVFLLLLKILPYAVLWVVFTFLYIFMPNTHVQFKSGLVAGILGGSIYQIVQALYIGFQVGVSKYGAIYGSFAALPLFLVWLQLSWLVVLFGAELSFAEQNVETHEFEPDSLKASHSFKRLVALTLTHHCVKRFCAAEPPQTAFEMAHELEIPIRLVREVIFGLTQSGILSEVKLGNGKDIAYQPARDVDQMSIKNVLDTLDNYGVDTLPLAQSEDVTRIRQSLQSFSTAVEKVPENVLLRNI